LEKTGRRRVVSVARETNDRKEDDMLKQLTHTQVWVHDQDEALAFYTEKLGMELREDVTVPEMGNFRWLSVGIPGQDVAITLMEIPGPPVFEEETRKQIQALLAKGASGGLFFGAEDVRKTCEELKQRGVEFTQEPTEQPYGVDAGFRDVSGNHFRVTEPPKEG
jgi:catechol 2,3-dioxygenase-like lactoylglutathione lyase family enzyme